MDRLRKTFLDVARAAKTAKDATGQASVAMLKPVPGGSGDFFSKAGGRSRSGLGLDVLDGARKEARDFQAAEKIFNDLRRREQKLTRESASAYGVLGVGQSTTAEGQQRREDRSRRRAARYGVLGGEAYGILPDRPEASGSAADPNAAKRSRIAFSLAEQRRREQGAAAGESQDQAARRSRITASLARQRRMEEQLERDQSGDQARRRSRVAFSLAEQRREEEQERRRTGFFGQLGGYGRRAAAGGRNVVGNTLSGGLLGGVAGGAGAFAGSLFGSTVGTLVGNGLGAIAGTIATAAGRVVSTGLHVFESAAVKALTEGSRREDAEVSFGALLGSSRRGKSLVGDVTDLAVKSPFSSGELLDQSKLLLSYGVAADDLTKTLSRLGDVASGAGVDLGRLSLAYGQVMAKGRLQGGELRQFTEAGVGVKDFAAAYNEQTGKRVGVNTFLQLSEQGQIGASVVEKAFEKMTSAGGRFFGMMDDRSRTFSGRLQALRESVDVFAGKVGKSFIENTSIGAFLDNAAGKVQGIDTKGLDNFFRGLNRTGGAFLGRVGRGAEGLLGGVGGGDLLNPNWDKFDERLNAVTEKTIPDLLDAGRDLTAGFLNVAAAAVRFGDFLSNIIPPDMHAHIRKGFDAEIQNRIDNAKDPREARRLRTLQAGLVDSRREQAARGGPDAGGVANFLDRQATALRQTNPGDRFRAGAAGGWFGKLIGPEGRGVLDNVGAAVGRAFGPEQLRADLEARRLNGLAMDVPTGDTRHAPGTWRKFGTHWGDYDTSWKDAAGREITVDEWDKKFDAAAAAAEKERKAAQHVAPGKSPGLTGADVVKFRDLAGKVRDRFGDLGRQFDEMAERSVPGFGKSLEELQKKLMEPPTDRPFTDFQRQMATAEAGRLKGRLGLDGRLDAEQFDRARLLAVKELRGKVGDDMKLGEPPPLLTAGSQATESAITKAMNAYQSGDKPTLEALLAQAKAAEDAQKARDGAALAALNAIGKKPGGFNFIGLNFGNPK